MPPTSHHFGSEPAGGRRYRLATVCLGILCFLLLLITTVLYVYYKGALSDIKKKHDILTKERSLLQTKYNTVKTERDQLQTNYSTVLADIQMKYITCIALKKQEHRCPVGWKSFDLKCYYISDTKKNWMESQVDCRQKGADLVVIDGNEEQTFLSQFQRSWIGLTDKEQEGIYKWVDGTPLTTSFWMNGEPNDDHGAEDCIEINLSSKLENWNDMPCSVQMNWICEHEGLD